jgi:hypothetical protein
MKIIDRDNVTTAKQRDEGKKGITLSDCMQSD